MFWRLLAKSFGDFWFFLHLTSKRIKGLFRKDFGFVCLICFSFVCCVVALHKTIKSRRSIILEAPQNFLRQKVDFLDNNNLDYLLSGKERGITSNIEVRDRQTLRSILRDVGIVDSQISKVIGSNEIQKLRLLPGQLVKLSYDCDFSYVADNKNINEDSLYYDLPLRHSLKQICTLLEMSIRTKDDNILTCTFNDPTSRPVVKIEKLSTKVVYKAISGVFDVGFYFDALVANVPRSIINQAIKQYSFVLDLQRDIKAGGKFNFIFEVVTDNDGNKIRDGNLLFSSVSLPNKVRKMYFFNGIYYDSEGVMIKKSLLRTPIDGARISSKFGKRKHPILGYTREHRGVDFAAKTGTKIFAAGDGTIEFVGVSGGYGKFITIKHHGNLRTNYAHMSNFAQDIKAGSKVVQGQVIGYVGTTGLSTGPHLHFEVMQGKERVNPADKYFNIAKSLKGKELEKFKHFQADVDQMLKNLS